MGSKNLKAVAVRGDNMPPAANTDGVKKMVDWLKANNELYKAFSVYGTGTPMARFEQLGNLPIRNFRDGAFPGADKIGAVTLKETISVGMDGCFACPVRCKKMVACEEPYHVDRAYGGPEYETIAALGSACGVDDLNAIAKGSELCNAYSLDTISTGLSVAFAMECFENGFLTSANTGGIDLKFGNADAMLKMIELIARREGIGDLLAEGSARIAEKVGQGSDTFAVQVKKLELPMHDPRISKALGLGYMVNPHGADHMDSLIDIFYCEMTGQPNVVVADALPLGFEPAPYPDIGPRKVALFKVLQTKRFIADSLVLCLLLPYSYSQYAELTAAVTGWDTSVMEQYRTAERIITMYRLFNVREGFSAEDDRLPARFFQPTRDGALSNTSLDYEEMEKAKYYYYHLMGWDDMGNPMPQKLEELGIDHLAAK
jgi:aldehyde:ferredoxin oxidoreductase